MNKTENLLKSFNKTLVELNKSLIEKIGASNSGPIFSSPRMELDRAPALKKKRRKITKKQQKALKAGRKILQMKHNVAEAKKAQKISDSK